MNVLDVALACFIGALGISTLFSSNPWYSLWGSMERSFAFSFWFFLFCAYLMLRQALTSDATVRDVYFASVISVLLMCAWGFAQAFIPGFANTFSGTRIGGTLGNAIFFGMYLTLNLGWILFMIVDRHRLMPRWWRISAAVAIPCIIAAILLTRSTGALLGAVVLVLSALIVFFFTSRRRAIIISMTTAVVVVLAVVIGIHAYQSGTYNTATTAIRLMHWRIAASTFLSNPFFGMGPEHYRAALDQHFDPRLTKYGLTETYADKPHNAQLELLVTTGVVGTAAYIFLLVVLLRAVWKLYRTKKMSRLQAALLIGLLIGREIQNATAFETHGTALMFMVLFSFVAAQDEAELDSKKLRSVLRCTYRLASIISVPLLIVGVLVPLGDARALHAALQGQTPDVTHRATTYLTHRIDTSPYALDLFKSVRETVIGKWWQRPDAVNAFTPAQQTAWETEVSQLKSTLDRVQQKNHTSAEWNLHIGQTWFQLFTITRNEGDGATAARSLIRANYLSPNRQEPLLLLGQLYLQQNKNTAALQTFDRIIELDPDWGTAYWYKGLALLVDNQTALGWAAIKQALDLQAGQHTPVVKKFIIAQLLKAGMAHEAEIFEQRLRAQAMQ